MLSTDGSGDSLTVDWISRNLYWVEKYPQQPNKHAAIVHYDLGKNRSEYTRVINRADIGMVVVNPYDQ